MREVFRNICESVHLVGRERLVRTCVGLQTSLHPSFAPAPISPAYENTPPLSSHGVRGVVAIVGGGRGGAMG